MDLTKGVFLDLRTVTDGDLDLRSLTSSLPAWDFRPATAAGDLAAALQDAQIVISNKVMLDSNTLQDAPWIRLLCVAATGTNNIDLAAAATLGITVCNVRGYATASVTEHVFMSILALSRRLHEHQAAIAHGDWPLAGRFSMLDYPFSELAGRTLGIIGYGELGRAVAATAAAFGLRILVAQRPGSPARPDRYPLNELLEQSDIISLHCPLVAATRNLIGSAELASMKPTALLINTARGGIVDEQALATALRKGQIAGAAVDVLAEEPPVHGNPLLADDIPNLIVTPHIAWAGCQSRQRLLDELATNIHAFLAGTPRNVVTG
jgi:glycerate dehydrogenase